MHCAAAALVVFLLTRIGFAAVPGQDIYARYADSVVTIGTYDETLFPLKEGSGIIIKTDEKNGSFILTNYHVIHRAGLIHVHTRGG